MTITGWSWEYIDEYMTLPRLHAMTEYWTQHPPVHILLGALLGIKSSTRDTSPNSNEAEKIMAEFAAAGFTVKTEKKINNE